MTIPFLALYLHNELHATPLVIGVTLGAAQLFATFGGIFGGYLTDKLGRKLVIIFTIFCLEWRIHRLCSSSKCVVIYNS